MMPSLGLAGTLDVCQCRERLLPSHQTATGEKVEAFPHSPRCMMDSMESSTPCRVAGELGVEGAGR
jgi:hypothetical protein